MTVALEKGCALYFSQHSKGGGKMEHRYDIVLDGHMGERFGTLVWSEADGIVSGVFSLVRI